MSTYAEFRTQQAALDQKAGTPTGDAAASKTGLQNDVAALTPRAQRYAQSNPAPDDSDNDAAAPVSAGPSSPEPSSPIAGMEELHPDTASEIVIDGDKARDLRSTEPRQPTQFDDAVPPTTTHSVLFCLLMLVQPSAWMHGSWSETADGWSGRDDKVLTFAEARVWIDERIAELGLDAQKVYSYPKSRGDSIQKYMAFLNSSFEEQMSQFLAA